MSSASTTAGLGAGLLGGLSRVVPRNSRNGSASGTRSRYAVGVAALVADVPPSGERVGELLDVAALAEG